jgi:high affinity Mn2+ porin
MSSTPTLIGRRIPTIPRSGLRRRFADGGRRRRVLALWGLAVVGVLGAVSEPVWGQDEGRAGEPRVQAPTPERPKEAQAEGAKKPEETPGTFHLLPFQDDPDWSFHYQGTAVDQFRGSMRSPYQSNLSLQGRGESALSYTTTLFLGRRLWEGAAIYFDPEIAGGMGLSNASGVAGFPNGEITRVNVPQPTLYIARLYLRQTFNFGDPTEKVEPGPNQLPEQKSPSNLELRFGKMALGDVFDDNRYSHDPRTQFLDWALFENGAWDYPADTRGYTVGPSIEFNQPHWSLRYGFFLEPRSANGLAYDFKIAANHGQVLEGELRFNLDEHPATVRLLGYANNARMGNFQETIANPAFGMDVTQTRKDGRAKYGLGLSADFEITPDLGVFLRAGWDDGKTESWAFTQIDRTLTPGVSLKGTCWGRPEDTFGLAYVVNGLSGDQRDYLTLGGQGFIIGDGKLNYGLEQILETYYALKILGTLTVSVDYQYVRNPAYNADRGPVNIVSLRIHVDF